MEIEPLKAAVRKDLLMIIEESEQDVILLPIVGQMGIPGRCNKAHARCWTGCIAGAA